VLEALLGEVGAEDADILSSGGLPRARDRSFDVLVDERAGHPPRALARTWKVSGLRTKAIEHWSLEQRDGVTIARTEQSWRGPLPRLLPGSMQNMLAVAVSDRLYALKRQAEQRASGSHEPAHTTVAER
jgi:hypothetical protein